MNEPENQILKSEIFKKKKRTYKENISLQSHLSLPLFI